MVFVNEVAEIVHGLVDAYGGSANKNIGDAFLLVWKIPDKALELDVIKDPKVLSSFGEMALLSFIRIMISL